MEYVSKEQQKIVQDGSRIRKISGCAGSRKTDTMIKCGIYYLKTRRRPQSCLFLTLVGSVTDEIKERLSLQLGIPIEKQGLSNHYIGLWKNHTIEIANYDAFIHRQLQEHDEGDSYSSDFDRKAEDLLAIMKKGHPALYLKNGSEASIVLVDEFQDISLIRAQILIEFFKKNKTCSLVVMGDLLQTIFPQALKDHNHPLMLIDELAPTEFRLNKCFRCPKGHLDVVNCITRPFRDKYQIPDIEAHFDLPDNKPLFFTHDAISTNHGALETATLVFQMVQTLLQYDPEIQYKDIVILMKKSNHQLVFQQLSHLFRKHHLGNTILLSRTKSFQNDHYPINWEEGKEKLMMLSIHGDKGKGHPVVFFLGFSGGTIPEERHYHKMEELLSQSLVNVAFTRSMKYLFIGMTRTYPSFYFYQCYQELMQIAYFSWKSNLIRHNVIQKICTEGIKNGNEQPILHRLNIRKQILQTPLRNIIFVNQDDRCKNFMKKCKINKYKIGHPIRFDIDDEKLYIIQACAKILFLKKVKYSILQSIFVPIVEMFVTKNVHFTDDSKILSHVKDHYLNRFATRDVYQWTQSIRKLGLQKEFQEPVLILHSIFKDSIFASIDNVMHQEHLDMQDLWRVGIFYLENIEHQSLYNILFLYHSGFEHFPMVIENLDRYIHYFRNKYPNGLKHFRFYQKASLIETINDKKELEHVGFQFDLETDKKVFSDGYRYGLASTIDFIDTHHNIQIDMKLSTHDCKDEWIFQAIIHSLISHCNNYIKIKKIHLYNLLKGTLYSFRLSSRYNLSEIIKELLREYEFSDFLIEKLTKLI